MIHGRPTPNYKRLLNPDELRSSLLAASLFVMAFETLKEQVVEHIHMLHWSGFDESGWKYDEAEYQRDVLSLHKNPFRASLLRFQKFNAIDDADLRRIEELTILRNRLVHDLWDALSADQPLEWAQRFSDLVDVLRKVEVWWLVNYELEGNPELEGKVIDEDAIVPGSVMMLRILSDVALASDDEAWALYNSVFNTRDPA
jgi:hypothetical protein